MHHLRHKIFASAVIFSSLTIPFTLPASNLEETSQDEVSTPKNTPTSELEFTQSSFDPTEILATETPEPSINPKKRTRPASIKGTEPICESDYDDASDESSFEPTQKKVVTAELKESAKESAQDRYEEVLHPRLTPEALNTLALDSPKELKENTALYTLFIKYVALGFIGMNNKDRILLPEVESAEEPALEDVYKLRTNLMYLPWFPEVYNPKELQEKMIKMITVCREKVENPYASMMLGMFALHSQETAQNSLVLLREHIPAPFYNFTKVFEAINSDISLANFYLGHAYYMKGSVNEEDTVQSYKTAVSYYHKAANEGIAEAYYCLGMIYENLYSGTPEEALKALQEGATKGSMRSQNQLGYMLARDLGEGSNFEETLSWHQKAALLGNENAPLRVALFRCNHNYIHHDFAEGIYWTICAHRTLQQLSPQEAASICRFVFDILNPQHNFDRLPSKDDPKIDTHYELDLSLEDLRTNIFYYQGYFNPANAFADTIKSPLLFTIFKQAETLTDKIEQVTKALNRPGMLLTCLNPVTPHMKLNKEEPCLQPSTLNGKIFWNFGKNNIKDASDLSQILASPIPELIITLGTDATFAEEEETQAQIKKIGETLRKAQQSFLEELTQGAPKRDHLFLTHYQFDNLFYIMKRD